MDTLTSEQVCVFNALRDKKNVFLTGRGGTGKSYLLDIIYNELPIIRQGLRISVTALTGCAAVLLGRHTKTLHSWAGVGLGKGAVKELVQKIRRNRKSLKNWLCTDLLIVDEISMMPPELLDKLDEIGRNLRRNQLLPFGGIQLLFVGDFLQLPPVTKGEEIRFAFESERWTQYIHTTIELTLIQRQKDDAFRQLLTEARLGCLSQDSIDILTERMGLNWRRLKIRPTLLFPRRAEVELINESNLKVLTGARHTYKAGLTYDEKVPAGFNPSDEEFKRCLEIMDRDASYMPELVLVCGAQVMLVNNMDIEKGLVNGSRGVVTGFVNNGIMTPIVEFLCGITMPIATESWPIEDYPGVLRSQVPLRLAYACTIHRSQGATLDCALIDIGRNTFEYGQAYVALSRVRSLDALYVHDFEPRAIRAHPRVLKYYEGIVSAAAQEREGGREEEGDDPVECNDESDANWLFHTLPLSWKPHLTHKKELLERLSTTLAMAEFLPKREHIWNALALTEYDSVKVLILGQDPYPTPGNAHGLAFSVLPDVHPIPGSLRNIYKEMEADIGKRPPNGSLDGWAKQGVLLLNTVLTVEAGKPQSHSKIGWEELTDEIIVKLRGRGVVFVLWGKSAQAKKKLLSGEHILEAPHPSPLSAHQGFFGSRPFSHINDLLPAEGKIIW